MRSLLALCAVAMIAAVGSDVASASASESPAACGNVSHGHVGLGDGGDPSTPPNPDGPTPVGLGIFVTQLRSLDAVREEYAFRGHIRATWCDPRLAFDAAEAGSGEKVYIGRDADRQRELIWLPGGYPANRSGSLETTERILRVFSDGTVHNDLNVSVELSAAFDLRRFPFDRQTLELVLDSFRWTAEEISFIPDPSTTGFSKDFSVQEWEIVGVKSRAETLASPRSSASYSRLTYEIEVERRAGFYLWKVMLPILIIVALSWSVFWMTDERLPGRSRITATGVLTVVAYQFVVADGLPHIAYLTLLDKMMLLSFSLLSVTVLQSMLVARYFDTQPETAHRIDKTSRWLFPVTYALLLAAIMRFGA